MPFINVSAQPFIVQDQDTYILHAIKTYK